ncbi:AAA family ATPase [Paraburkholderia atlantica]|uniref:AAA family ATPase n=1 Tax=Paraburkholderia atlantica TaxID=2654982 RepID=UPI0017F7E687|nr:AAA family ATPase [Paraburkholderia atlantica]MBB5510459.1 putative ATPase/two-component sensor histidine kinase [Paraburkholderia atlantica]
MSDQMIATANVLVDDGELVLMRAGADAAEASLLLVPSPNYQHPAARLVERFTNALSVRALLDLPRIARPRRLIDLDGQPALLLDDPGGMPLAGMLGSPWPLASFLEVATALSGALGELHRRDLISRDVRPATILVTEANSVALTGFGFASIASREHDVSGAPVPAAAEVGSLIYTAPELTGRMSRAVDARCDLYSLGVVLYQMLTGELPFTATTAVEWIHAHMTQRPTPVLERVPGVPSVVASIVMTLLMKNADERYQSAAALESDLRRCMDQWSARGAIDIFDLTTHDTVQSLAIPDQLYGREADLAELGAAYARVQRAGRCELVLVAGHSGVGKSALVEHFAHGLPSRFVTGKFDQFKRDIPYATLAQALQASIRHILAGSDEVVEHWRTRLRDAVGSSGHALIELIPELQLVIGAQPPLPDLSPQDAHARFNTAMRRFIAAFGHPGEPLVLFLDDLQWLDAATLLLLEQLTGDAPVPDLLIIGAYRDNEVDAAHPLARIIDGARSGSNTSSEIVLKPLGADDLCRMIGNALGSDVARTRPLADLLYQRTGGNPLFANQLLVTMAGSGQIGFDVGTRVWRWDLAAVRLHLTSGDIVDLMIERIDGLSATAREVLAFLACLGDSVPLVTLAQVSGCAAQRLEEALSEATKAGLVVDVDGSYRMIHDRVQEAAYATVPPDARAQMHLRIARALIAHTPSGEIERRVFEIVSQLNRASGLIDAPAEREQAANLNLMAGRRAKASTAYASARQYLTAGFRLCSAEVWSENYRLVFALEYNLAECEFLTGDTESARIRLAALATRAVSLVDRAAVAWLRVTLFTALDRSDIAVDLCLDYLRAVGVDWNAHPTREEACAEYQALLAQIGTRSIESLIDVPALSDPDRRATLDVLTAVLPPAFFSDQNLVCLVLCRMANLSLAFGNSDASSLGYAYLGMVAGPCFGDYEAGFRFGQLGLSLVDERGLDRFQARVYMCFAYHVMPWTRHIRTGLQLLGRAFDVASERGDLTYIGFSSCTLITSLLAAGVNLVEVERLAQERLELVQAAKFGLIVDIITGQLRLIRTLRGSVQTLTYDESAFESHLAQDPCLAIADCWYWIRKLQASYLCGDMVGALIAADRAEPLLWTSSGHFEVAEFHLYAMLARVAALEDGAALSPALRAHYAQLSQWAEHSPDNFRCRLSLVQAELACREGESMKAMRHYDSAIAEARENGFPQIEALANERAAKFYEEAGFIGISQLYFRNARAGWEQWGATSRVAALAPRCVDANDRLAAPDTQSTKAALPTTVAPLDSLDLAGIVESSQALSNEVDLERLIRVLMNIMLEHAGAERALLVIPHDDALWVEAEASTGRSGTQVGMDERAVSADLLPLSLLHYAIRTRQYVLLDGAQRSPEQFTADPYLLCARPRSALCLPLLNQNKPVGALYLENNLMPGVFTPSRVAALQLLASQAAISLENASLHQKEVLFEEKDALLKEVHHRVKNNLQLISSLLNLQAANVTDPVVAALFADSRNRVRSMALVHENLYRAGNFARIPMAMHIERLCGHLTRAYDLNRQRVELELVVDDIELDMNTATSCGLVINELVSNALKHAFAGRGGHLRVSLQRDGDEQYQLRVADDGIGIGVEIVNDVASARVDSLGLQLVQDLTQQIRGTLAVEVDNGTCFTIMFNSGDRRNH